MKPLARKAAPTEPERLGTRREERAIEIRLRIPPDLAFLEGHFPGRPIVAGVVEVHFAMQALGELLDGAPAPATLEALKFHELLLPGQEARLRVELYGDGSRFRFSLVDAAREERRFASGRGKRSGAGAGPQTRALPRHGARLAAIPPVAELLPHSGPMRLLERVLAHDADGTRCAVWPGRSALFRDATGRVPCWVAAEYMAQCAAVDGSLRLRARGVSPRPVLFVGSRRIAFHREAFDPSQRLEVEARYAAGRPGGLVAFDCALFAGEGGDTLAEGRLNVLAGDFDPR